VQGKEVAGEPNSPIFLDYYEISFAKPDQNNLINYLSVVKKENITKIKENETGYILNDDVNVLDKIYQQNSISGVDMTKPIYPMSLGAVINPHTSVRYLENKDKTVKGIGYLCVIGQEIGGGQYYVTVMYDKINLYVGLYSLKNLADVKLDKQLNDYLDQKIYIQNPKQSDIDGYFIKQKEILDTIRNSNTDAAHLIKKVDLLAENITS